jgi:hypothetical protein
MENKVEIYLNTLSEKELIALKIAQTQLGSSFSIEKSIGFVKWNESNKISMNNNG